MEVTKGIIHDIAPNGDTIIHAKISSIQRALLRRYSEVLIGFSDGRNLSAKQMRKIYALLGEIAEWMGDTTENTKALMKINFNLQIQAIGKKIVSLKDCDMTTAREFITLLIDFILENDIPTKEPLYLLNDDISRYIYACLMNKKCCVCGRPAQLHHVQRVGMGRNRDDIYQIDMLVLPLCEEHHAECHTMAQKEFNGKYHIEPIKLTKEIGKKYKLNKKNLEGG